MHSPSNSNGTTIPCSWLVSFPVLCWVHIACPPPGLVFLFLPSPTKDKLFSQFSSSFTLKDGEPCDLVTPPRIVSREAVPLTLEQAQTLLRSVREHRLEVLLAMAVVTGMRRGELLALRWSNIDLEHKTLLVLHTVDYIPKYGYVETEPKTAASRRLISLPSFLIDMLKQHRVQQLKQQQKQGDSWENRDLVFPDLHGGYFNPNYLLIMFKKLLKEAGLPHMHFHDLRHSAATILLSMGVNMKIIQELLGHSDIAITLGKYSHLLPTMQKEVAEKWDDEFRNDGEG